MNRRFDRNALVLAGFLAGMVSMGVVAQETPPAPPADTPKATSTALTNDGIIQLVQLGLGDEVVKAKINESQEVAFDTSVEALQKLKEAGVSSEVLTAMLNRNTPKPASALPPQAQEQKLVVEVHGVHLGPSDVFLCSSDGDFKLRSALGSPSATYAYLTVLTYSDFPGLRAPVRVKDPQPSILLRSDDRPDGRFFFVKAKVDKGDNVRSVKMGRMRVFSAKSLTAPDKDWVVETKLTEEQPGVWRLTPAKKLECGEYGLWVLGAGAEMYDFGIDK